MAEAPSHKRLGGPHCLSSFALLGDISSFVLLPSIPLWQFNYFTERGELLLELEMTKEKPQSWWNFLLGNLTVAWKWATAERDVLAFHRHQELKSKEKLMKDTALIHLSPLPNINTGRRNNMRRVWVRVWRHPGGCWVGNCRYIPGSFTGIAQLANGWTTYFFS